MKGLPRPEPAEFFAEVERRAGPHDALAGAVDAVVDCLAMHLTDPEKHVLVGGMPAGLGERLLGRPYVTDATPDLLVDEVTGRTGLAQGRALELVESVAQTIGDRLGDGDVAILAKQSPAIAALFAKRAFGSAPSHGTKLPSTPPPARTLADGKPGTKHPMSEAHPERAHAHSVARNPDPHGDTKVSSAHGTTQEALAEDLAEGKPGPHPSWDRED